MNSLRLNILQRYILRQFLGVLILCLFAATSLFLVFETFERMRVFVREEAAIGQVLLYLTFKTPLIIHLMTPVAVLVAALISVGRLSQLSEITAMRACGASILSLAKPLILAGFVISFLMFAVGETVVPWATQRVDEIYNLDIRKKDIKGNYSKKNFWYRDKNIFYRIGYYDSRNATLKAITILEFDDHFVVRSRVDAQEAVWGGNTMIGWTMKNVVETTREKKGEFHVSRYRKLPLVIEETPQDFFNKRQKPETLSYTALKEYIKKLSGEGVPVTRYLVDLAAKISFPFVNVVALLVAFPFALTPARSGNLSMSFVAGVSIGFGYYVVHALCTSLGGAELIPVIPSAWAANILLGSIGGYLMAGAEYS